jgi:hypothetical protein
MGFRVEKILTVSHFRLGALKRLLPSGFLAALDGLFQPTGAWFQLTPSVFVKSILAGQETSHPEREKILDWFQCPECGAHPLADRETYLECSGCGRKWAFRDGIYDFREAL